MLIKQFRLMLRKFLIASLPAAIALLFSGCSTPTSFYAIDKPDNLLWQMDGNSAKVKWVGELGDYHKEGFSEGVWKSVLHFFTGDQSLRITKPRTVLMDSTERLFVADPGVSVVHILDIKNKKAAVIPADDKIQLYTPVAVAEDGAGRLYISDSKAKVVYLYEIESKSLLPFITKGVERPTGLAYNKVNKLLYIADTVAGEVVAVDPDGVEKFRFGSAKDGETEFNHPVDLWIDKKGQLYVTDSLNYKIKIFTPEGQLINSFGTAGDSAGSFNKQKGIAVDSFGNIYVCDSLQDVVQIFDDTGRYLMSFGNNGIKSGEFWMPSGIYIDQHDFIYVADTFNQRIQIFRYVSQPVPGSDNQKKRQSDPVPNGE